MKLNKKHIGKKVVYDGREGYFIPYGFQRTDSYTYVYGKAYAGHRFGADPSENRIPDVDYFSILDDELADWQLYDENQEWFDFSRFGCHEKHVKELVKALDKRYSYSEDKKSS